jgi:hypothetical protein
MALSRRLVELNLERLRRHYEAAVLHCDEASLLDLAVALRNWVEMARELPTLHTGFGTSKVFETRAANSRVNQVVSHGRHVVAFLPGGVVTRAVDGVLVHYPDPPSGGQAVGAFQARRNPDNSIEVQGLFWPDIGDFQQLQTALERTSLKRFAFREWLDAEVVRVGYFDEAGNLQQKALDRTTLVKRVANTLGGAHPAGMNEDAEANSFDAALQFLLQFWINGATLPYFILLKIAMELLAHAPALMAASRAPN